MDERTLPEIAVIEVRLAQLWQQALAVDRVEPDDDFFELGGNSISAIRLVPLLADHFGVETDLTAIFDHPTPRKLAQALAGLRAATNGNGHR